jgi:hypothetical protein
MRNVNKQMTRQGAQFDIVFAGGWHGWSTPVSDAAGTKANRYGTVF